MLQFETLRQNSTFLDFYDNLENGKSKIYYLDNPFTPKPLDKVKIHQLFQKSNEPDEVNINLCDRLLNYKRQINNYNDKNEALSENSEQKNTNNEVNEKEFITKISQKFVYLNKFDFEETPYVKN